MNKIELMGRLVADVELKKATKKGGADYTRFTLAVPRKNEKDKTDFISCVSFGKLAEVISKYCKKGQRIIVCGSLQIDTVEKDGAKTNYTTVIVNDFYFTEYNKEVSKSNESTPEELPFG